MKTIKINTNYPRKMIMKRAHTIARKLEGDYIARLSYGLKKAHLEYKLGMLKTTSMSNLEFLIEIISNSQLMRTDKKKEIGSFGRGVYIMHRKATEYNNHLLKQIAI
jgi:hypothetical protein